jgi:hypothetical protein
MLPDGTKIDKNKEYTVVVNNYMYGNPQYQISELADGKYETGPEDLQATIDYVKSLPSPVKYEAEGRISEVTVDEVTPFEDVSEDHWAYEFVTDLQAKGIIKGTSATTFSPSESLTRTQFASFLVRSLELTADKAAPFTDLGILPEDIKAEINVAYANGLIKGTTAETFEPKKAITRAEMVTMLIRAYNLKNNTDYKAKETSFEDIQKLNAEMKNAVAAAEELGYVVGFGDLFKPTETATRAQSAKVLSLFLK